MQIPRVLALSILLAGLIVLPAPSVSSTTTPIQPGAQVTSSIGSCTLNFFYDGVGPLAGRTFVGTAAHCVEEVGDKVDIVGHYGFTVFYVGDVPNAINSDGRGDNGIPGQQLDFALIELTGVTHPMTAEVKGHPGWPNGQTTSSGTGSGDTVHLSGYGMGFSFTAPTREMRLGVLFADDPHGFSAYAPAMPGDSGGPVLHGSGKALGIASTIGGNGLAGPTVQGVVAEMAAIGMPIQLRTA